MRECDGSGAFCSEAARPEWPMIGPISAASEPSHTSLCGSHSLPSAAFRCQARLLQQHRHFSLSPRAGGLRWRGVDRRRTTDKSRWSPPSAPSPLTPSHHPDAPTPAFPARTAAASAATVAVAASGGAASLAELDHACARGCGVRRSPSLWPHRFLAMDCGENRNSTPKFCFGASVKSGCP